MKIVFGATYTLPTLSKVKGRSFDVRNSDVKKAFSHGATENGDGKVDARNIDIEVLLEGTSTSDYQSKLDALQAAFYRDNYKLFITDDRYINIRRLDKFKEELMVGYSSRATLTISLRCTDPFFYALASTSASQSAGTNPFQFMVNNPGTVDTPLIVKFAPTVNAFDIKLMNLSDGGKAFTYKDTSLTAPAVGTINGIDGTVYRNSSNAINAFAGVFLRLLPGDNTFVYTGDPVSITTQFTARYL